MLVPINLAQATTGAVVSFVPVPFACRLVSITLVGNITLAANGTNHLTITVKAADGATALASRTTNSGGGAGGTTLTAGTVEGLAITNFDDSGLTANQAYKIETAVGGTLANATDFTLVFEFEAARSV
tara:strand:+ start:766 stop:1149 length:384 start_codon:yes stop_codon:yes gene_type:complete